MLAFLAGFYTAGHNRFNRPYRQIPTFIKYISLSLLLHMHKCISSVPCCAAENCTMFARWSLNSRAPVSLCYLFICFRLRLLVLHVLRLIFISPPPPTFQLQMYPTPGTHNRKQVIFNDIKETRVITSYNNSKQVVLLGQNVFLHSLVIFKITQLVLCLLLHAHRVSWFSSVIQQQQQKTDSPEILPHQMSSTLPPLL